MSSIISLPKNPNLESFPWVENDLKEKSCEKQIKKLHMSMHYRYMNFFLPVIRLVSNDKKKDMKHNGHAGRDGVLITAEYWVQDYHII